MDKLLKDLTPEQIWNEFANSNLRFNEALPNWAGALISGHVSADELGKESLVACDPN